MGILTIPTSSLAFFEDVPSETLWIYESSTSIQQPKRSFLTSSFLPRNGKRDHVRPEKKNNQQQISLLGHDLPQDIRTSTFSS